MVVLVYAVVLFRLMPRRALGGMAAVDIAVTVIVGSALSRALTGNADMVPTLVATAVLAGLHAGLSWLARRSSAVSRLAKGRPIRLVHDGTVDRAAMRRAELGDHDLGEALRLEGIADIAEVRSAFLERNGAISIVRAGG